MTTSISTSDLNRRMHGALEALRHDLGGLRTGRASIALVDPIHVEVYGSNMMEGLWQIVSGKRSFKEIGGPVKIAQIAGQQATLGIEDFIALLALLSINLGFINLLPVPMLDGGHLFFYAIEAVRRRPVSAQALDWAFRGGLALILALLVFATFNDLGLWNQLERLIG